MSNMGMLDQAKDMWRQLKSMNRRQFAHQLLNLALVAASAVIIWKGLIVMSGSESPVVVVLSGSMEPAFYRGDILFLWMGSQAYRVGEIVVFKIPGRETPIVHRILEMHTRNNGAIEILTKGDNNEVDDRGLYEPGKMWITPKHISGRVIGFLPYMGMVTILLTDYPLVKFALLGIMALFALTTKES